MPDTTERARHGVTPNRRGARSREAVLDAAERLIAQRGYRAATVAALVEEAGVPASSIYHYFDSKQGVFLAAVERGAERFFAELPVAGGGMGSERERLQALLDAVAAAFERRPAFPRILVVMAAQPAGDGDDEVHRVVGRVRELALERLREEMHVAFGLDATGAAVDQLARFSLAMLAGAVIARRSHRAGAPGDVLEHLPAALLAARREVAPGARPAVGVRRTRRSR